MPEKIIKRDVIVSIRPNYASQILNGQKTVELRRKFPSTSATGALALIYSSSPVQAIVGYATISDVVELSIGQIWRQYGKSACIDRVDFFHYFEGLNRGFVILLSNVRALQKQLSVAHLSKEYGFVPPQSFRYLDEDYRSLLRHERLQVSR